MTTAFQRREGALFRIESQVSFALRLVGSVTMKAVVREDRPNVAVEFDVRCNRLTRRCGQAFSDRHAERKQQNG